MNKLREQKRPDPNFETKRKQINAPMMPLLRKRKESPIEITKTKSNKKFQNKVKMPETKVAAAIMRSIESTLPLTTVTTKSTLSRIETKKKKRNNNNHNNNNSTINRQKSSNSSNRL